MLKPGDNIVKINVVPAGRLDPRQPRMLTFRCFELDADDRVGGKAWMHVTTDC